MGHHAALRTTATATALALGLLAFGGSPAQAKGGDDDILRSGSCSGSTDWKLKVKPDDGRLEMEFEVDSDVVGQTWSVRVTDNGTRVFAGPRQTAGRSGSFSVERRVTDRAGADRFVATASNAATGETCRGTLTFPA